MTTPHIQAKPEQFASTCLLPGDPLRAKFIAETYLTDVELINSTRNMLAYTGSHQGSRVSVMGTGMGMPSCMLYSEELIKEFGVRRLIRVGSCGSTDPELGLNDLVLAAGASTDSNANRLQFGGYDYAAIADFELLTAAAASARKRGVDARVGNVFSTDSFYHPNRKLTAMLNRLHILAVEMEAAGLYSVAARHRAQALAILTVSDHLITHQQLSSEERERSFDTMIRIALEVAVDDV